MYWGINMLGSVAFKVSNLNETKVFDCFGWVTGGDGRTYGVCSDNDSQFVLIPYDELKPVKNKKING